MPGSLWPETCGLPSSLFSSHLHPSIKQVSSFKWIHCLCSKRLHSLSLAGRAVASASVPALYCHCCPASWHGALASCYLRLYAVIFYYKTFRNSANCLASYHPPHKLLQEPLGLNRKATTERQRLLPWAQPGAPSPLLPQPKLGLPRFPFSLSFSFSKS